MKPQIVRNIVHRTVGIWAGIMILSYIVFSGLSGDISYFRWHEWLQDGYRGASIVAIPLALFKAFKLRHE